MSHFHERADFSHKGQEGLVPSHKASSAPVRSSSAEGLVGFVDALNASGVHVALRFLNARVRFRFTEVSRCEPPVVVIRSLYDRENPSLEGCGGIRQLKGTFCSIVVATGEPFSTEDALADPSLHPYPIRHTVISYSGVPIRSPGGQVAGVLCHYDLRPRLLPSGELNVMRSVAQHLAQYLQGPVAMETEVRGG